MKTIGITGGIGSGKSMLTKFIQLLNFPVYNSDLQAKYLMENDINLKNDIINKIGKNAYCDNKLNTKYIANKIFSDNILRENFNNLVHKRVYNDFIKFTKKCKSDLVFIESALLFESGIYKKLNYNILLVSPLDVRKKRLYERGMSASEINKRINAQLPDNITKNIADFIIFNDEKKLISKQFLKIIKTINK